MEIITTDQPTATLMGIITLKPEMETKMAMKTKETQTESETATPILD